MGEGVFFPSPLRQRNGSQQRAPLPMEEAACRRVRLERDRVKKTHASPQHDQPVVRIGRLRLLDGDAARAVFALQLARVGLKIEDIDIHQGLQPFDHLAQPPRFLVAHRRPLDQDQVVWAGACAGIDRLDHLPASP